MRPRLYPHASQGRHTLEVAVPLHFANESGELTGLLMKGSATLLISHETGFSLLGIETPSGPGRSSPAEILLAYCLPSGHPMACSARPVYRMTSLEMRARMGGMFGGTDRGKWLQMDQPFWLVIHLPVKLRRHMRTVDCGVKTVSLFSNCRVQLFTSYGSTNRGLEGWGQVVTPAGRGRPWWAISTADGVRKP